MEVEQAPMIKFNYELIDRIIQLADIAVKSKTNEFELGMLREIQKITTPPFIAYDNKPKDGNQ